MAKGLVFLVLSLALVVVFHSADAQVPPIFIFGDSTADVGTDNFLPGSTARADFPHNGIDFPNKRPTGRFSNGLNSADLLAKLMGYKRSPPPFFSSNIAYAAKKNSFRGINFASGGSGLLDVTGQTVNNQKNVVPLSEQIEQFFNVHGKLMAAIGPAGTENFLSKSLFFISTGSNDIFTYYHSTSTLPKQEFISTLALAYENYLRALLNLGARKFGIISVPPIGCCPSQRIYNATGGCLEELNEYARAFHVSMETLMCKLSSEYKDMKYSLGNTYEMTINVIDNPAVFKFKEVKSACCGDGKFNGESFCVPNATLCSKRHQYLFWDLFHPTQTASKLAAVTLYTSDEQRFVSPINFSQLATA
ncbi:GDSL esterase/lipase At5g55050-like [Mangifera indica]|uniref:GDSL esterase/lipase At5g55050-like n=1 Tax=Mangifera indica TaxID=29780 RepID=UPI001CFABF31|nr:GDSL esterase/lipase At5g55050-like [Mangifera indica]